MIIVKIKRISKFYKYLIFTVLIVLIIAMLFVLLISFFPIRSTATNFNNSHFARFISPWPVSSLDQEYLDRKKIRRYSKSEQKKRLEKQLQKMNVLSVPIYDLSLDDEAELSINESKYYPDKTDFLWPILPKSKKFNNSQDQTLKRRSINLVLPSKNWTSLYEGVYLSSGDEIKTNIPIIKDKRYLNFLIFPLTPGNIRVILGQYVWTKTFGEEDVNKIQKIVIPINDSTATNIRVLSISSSCYINDLSINQILKNGREPIQVSSESQLWSPNKKYLINQFQDEISSSEEDAAESAEDNSATDENTNIDLKGEESKNIEVEKQLHKVNQDETDPLLQYANKEIIVDNEYSTAFGYNVVFIQTPPINSNLLKDKNLLNKIAPNISNLMENSVIFENNIYSDLDNINLFKQTIFQDYMSLYDNNPLIFQYKIEHNQLENTYQKFRRYGYKVVSITHPESLFFSRNFVNTDNFFNYYNRWLDFNDWIFQSRNIKIDDKSGTNSGLDAIFNTNNSKKIQSHLSSKDYAVISNYLTEISKNVDKIPNWHPNEYMLISNKNYYTSKVLGAFQNWTESYQQNRFFAHILLDSNTINDRPNLSNLKKSIVASGVLSLTKPKYLKTLASFSYLDMGIGEILNTVKAKRIENRTLIFVLIPDINNNYKSAIYKIPGLIGKKYVNKNINVKDIMSTIFSNIGIPTGRNIKNNPAQNDGNMLEVKNYIVEKPSQKEQVNFLKYSLILKSNANHCHPLIWKSNDSAVFAPKSNYPVFRNVGVNTIEIFPCSILNKFIELTWYQNNNMSLQTNSEITLNEDELNSKIIIDKIGGHFHYLKNNLDFPEVFFGSSLISYNDLFFMFNTLSNKNIEDIFYVDEKYLNKTIAEAKDSFSTYDDINEEKHSKIALFITPL